MSRAGAKRVVNGQVALVMGALRLGRMDEDRPEFALLMDQVLYLIEHLDFRAPAIDAGPLLLLSYAIKEHNTALEAIRRLPSGERNWNEVTQLQGEVRRCVNKCAEALFGRCYGIWAGGADARAMAVAE